MRFQLFALPIILGLIALFASCVVSQTSAGLTQCWLSCISHRDGSCNNADPSCICHLASGRFLTEVVMCLVQNCNDPLKDPEPQVFITQLQMVCQLNDFPIPSAAISTAELVIETASALSDFITSTAVGVVTDSAGQPFSIDIPIIYHSTRSSTSHTPSSTSALSSGSIILLPSVSPTTADTAVPSVIETATSSSSATTSPSTTKKSSGGDGTVLDIQSISSRKGAGGLLSLTIGLLAGIIWF